MAEHCSDLQGDRAIGNVWERNFCALAAQHYGKSFTAHQIGRKGSAVAMRYVNGYHPLTLPDITIWSMPGEHHEIKHKRPHVTYRGEEYGLEVYRLNALKWFADETQQSVYYTIHRWDKLGTRDNPTNRYEDWETANVNKLWQATIDGTARSSKYPSWVAGEKKIVTGWYWPTDLWQPLEEMWEIPF